MTPSQAIKPSSHQAIKPSRHQDHPVHNLAKVRTAVPALRPDKMFQVITSDRDEIEDTRSGSEDEEDEEEEDSDGKEERKDR